MINIWSSKEGGIVLNVGAIRCPTSDGGDEMKQKQKEVQCRRPHLLFCLLHTQRWAASSPTCSLHTPGHNVLPHYTKAQKATESGTKADASKIISQNQILSVLLFSQDYVMVTKANTSRAPVCSSWSHDKDSLGNPTVWGSQSSLKVIIQEDDTGRTSLVNFFQILVSRKNS